jgi:hypothetical protein
VSISKNEVGRDFKLSTGSFDMSSSTGLSLLFTKPDGSTLLKTEASANPVTAPAVALVNDPDLGDQPASTYFQFTSVADDFDQAGTWAVCGTYTDVTPKVYYTEDPPKEFEVLESCA